MFWRGVFLAGLVGAASPAGAELFLFDPPSGRTAQELTVYSTLDEGLAAPLIRAFQEENPDVAVRYEDLLTFKYTGPWPPYNFVNIKLKLEKAN